MDARTIVVMAALVAVGCQSSPVAPTVSPPPAVPAVPTAAPNTWDSREELAAWVGNDQSRGGLTLAGDGVEAVIRVDMNAGNALLRGPDLDPPVTMTAARVRYRWLDKGA